MLARRLIYGQSQSMDAEEAMINRLKVSRLAPTANKLLCLKNLEVIILFVEPLIPYFELLVTSALGFKAKVEPSRVSGGFHRITFGATPSDLWWPAWQSIPFTHFLFSSIDGSSKLCHSVLQKPF